MTTHVLQVESTRDGELIEATLELAAARHPDITPLVYARFFERCPEARSLFRVVDPQQPPRIGERERLMHQHQFERQRAYQGEGSEVMQEGE